jgi:two-component system, OmpR family, phosphate regulon response regulator PhoB
MPGKILIVEDEAAIREMLRFALARAGYRTLEAADAEQAQRSILQSLPDLILLDWMLPNVSGIDYARQLKQADYTRNVPLIILTARGEEEDKVRGLETGADDYVTKPFSPRELLARIKAVLRRVAPQATDEAIEMRGLQLDPASHRILARGERLEMGPTEFRLLHFFMTHPERVYSRRQLLDMIWGVNAYVEERTVDVHIRRLRKVLEPAGYDDLIETVRGVGYRLSGEG